MPEKKDETAIDATNISAPTGAVVPPKTKGGETHEQRAARIAATLGYGSNVIGSNRILFNEQDASPQYGLFLAQIDEVTVTTAEYAANEDKPNPFSGHQVPRINILWSNGNPDKSKAKYYNHSFNAVQSTVETFIKGKEAWKVRIIYQHMVHYLETYLMKAKGLPPIEVADAIAGRINDSIFPIVDGKTNYNGTPVYNLVPVEEVLEDYRRRFQAFADVMNYGVDANGNIRKATDADAKPLYKDVNGKPIKTWILLLRSYKSNGVWKTSNDALLSIPNFIRSGVLEIEVAGKAPVLRLDKSTMSLNVVETPKGNRIGAMPPIGGAGFIPAQQMPAIQQYAAGVEGEGSSSDLPF